MTKKYSILNTNFNRNNFTMDYIFYIVIFILTVYFIIQFTFINYNEYFENLQNKQSSMTNQENIKSTINTKNNNLNNQLNNQLNEKKQMQETKPETKPEIENKTKTPLQIASPNFNIEQELQEIKIHNDALLKEKNVLEEKMKKQSRSVYLSNNFYKIDDSSFNNQVSFINDNINDVRLPESEFTNKKLIKTQQEWNNILKKANDYKNLYKVGDVVIKPSDYNITKDDICYKDHKQIMSSEPDFKTKYPECMVCSVNPETDYKNTKSWKNTKTNIHKVCLFNPSTSTNSSILNYDGCKNLCN